MGGIERHQEYQEITTEENSPSSSTESNQSRNPSSSSTASKNPSAIEGTTDPSQITYTSAKEICQGIINELGENEAKHIFLTELNYCEFSSPDYHRSEADNSSQDTIDRSGKQEDAADDRLTRINRWQTEAVSKQEDTIDHSRKRSIDYNYDNRYFPTKQRNDQFLENLSRHVGNQISFLQKVAEYCKNYRRYPCADCTTLNTFIRNSLDADISSAEFMKEIIDLAKKYKAKDEEIGSNLDFLTTEERILHEWGLRIWGTTKVEDRATISGTKNEEHPMKNRRPPSNSKEPISD